MTGDEVIKLRDALRSQRAPFESHWNELAAVFTPFRRIGGELPDLVAAAEIHDTTARHAAEIFANGLCALILPREDTWFELQPPKPLADDDEAVKFYREASETQRNYLEASNFYEEAQESLIESPVFGTCSLYCGELDEETDELCFLHQPIGSYYIGENARGRVNTHVRDLFLTADQAAEEFGAEALPQKISSKVGTPAGMTEKHGFIHLVTKRKGPPDDGGPEGIGNRPFIDVVVDVESKSVIRRSGAWELPFAAHRYRRYGKTVWGFGPGCLALGDARQLSFLNELADLGTEKEVFPPLLAAASLEGEIAQGALEVTYYDEHSSGLGHESVKPLHQAGRLQTLQWRMEAKSGAIDRAFYVDLFKLFSRRVMERGPMTATEANLVAGEKLTQFSPVYGRIMSEMVDAVLSRVFGVLFRAGKFGRPPASVARVLGDGRTQVALPSIVYRNRIALAMKAKENGALLQFFEVMLPVLQVFPQMAQSTWNALEAPAMLRDLLRNSGTPERWIASLKDMEARQKADAEAVAQRAAMENAELATKAAGNLGKAPQGVLDGMGGMAGPPQPQRG
jgi:hypothetical protein